MYPGKLRSPDAVTPVVQCESARQSEKARLRRIIGGIVVIRSESVYGGDIYNGATLPRIAGITCLQK